MASAHVISFTVATARRAVRDYFAPLSSLLKWLAGLLTLPATVVRQSNQLTALRRHQEFLRKQFAASMRELRDQEERNNRMFRAEIESLEGLQATTLQMLQEFSEAQRKIQSRIAADQPLGLPIPSPDVNVGVNYLDVGLGSGSREIASSIHRRYAHLHIQGRYLNVPIMGITSAKSSEGSDLLVPYPASDHAHPA